MRIRCRVEHAFLVGVLFAGPLVLGLQAQEKLTDYHTLEVGPQLQMWSFGAGLYQPTVGGTDSVALRSARQWSVPLSVSIPIGSRWNVDVSGAYTASQVSLRSADNTLNTDSYSANGLTDTRIRFTGRFMNDNVLVTAGINAPTGLTGLTNEQLSALRVIAAPALGFQIPTLGIGPGATGGLVVARDVASMAWAVGASYEYRGSYSPIAVAGGLPAFNMSPGGAVHLSLATDGAVGQNEMSLGMSGDFFTENRLQNPGSVATARTRLGPIFGADWKLQIAQTSFRELTLFAADRYRTAYQANGATVSGSNGNYLDLGVRSVYPISSSTGFLAVLSARHNTGLGSDPYVASAGAMLGAVTLGVEHQAGDGYVFQPFVRGQIGQLKSGGHSASAIGGAVGVSLGRHL